MENPNKEAYEMGKWPWIWDRKKVQIIAGTVITIALWIYAALDPDETPWYILVIAFPAWFGIWYAYYVNLYKTQIRSYHSWEENYADKFSENK